MSHISIKYGLRGASFVVSSACSSSNHAIAQALQLLRAGRADIVLAGGAEASLAPGFIKAWEVMRVLASGPCRPFSLHRDGLVLGEGAAVFVLETEAHAIARGAPILAELAGAGMSSDASHMLNPDEEGAAAAMQAALDDAGWLPEQVDYINAHGTGTRINDVMEARAIRKVFGSHADGIAVSSTKAMHGHLIGAAGAIELVAAIGAIVDAVVPPTLHVEEQDPACDLDVVPDTARDRRVRAALSNSFAFGGTNAVVAVGAWQA